MFEGHFDAISGIQREMSPFTEFLTSPTNTAGVLQKQIDAGNGHKRQVQLIYEARDTENQVGDSAVQDCNGGDKPGEDSTTYEIDETVGSTIKWTISHTDLIDRCEDDATFFARQLIRKLDVIGRKINTDNWTAAAALLGNFADGAATAEVVKTRENNGAYSPDALEVVQFQFMELDYNGPVALFGGSQEFYTYFQSMAGMCCNTTLGIDVAALFASKSLVPFYDRKSQAALGAGHFLGLRPGALQFITYNQFNSPKFVMDTEIYKQGVITDPFTGISYDYIAKFDCGNWHFQLKLAHDLVGVPTDLFCADDRLSGVTWVNDFIITNPEVCDCPA